MGDGFAWTVPLILVTFGALFLAAHKAGAAREAWFWGVGFILSASAYAVPALPGWVPVQAVALTADTLFALSFFCFARSIVTRYGAPSLPRVRAALLVVGIAAPAHAVLVLQDLPAELFASDITCALQLFLALVTVPRWPRGWIDRGLIAISWAVVLENLARTASVPLAAGHFACHRCQWRILATSIEFLTLELLAEVERIVRRVALDAFNRRQHGGNEFVPEVQALTPRKWARGARNI